ncbi:phosphotransferase family protein [Streptomyces sp. NPDC056723]|uniref:phosphotransferase family protein n=1 Tax=unclassified Streptomyces TaxID=2593676 RepID=UPI00367C89C7
MTESPVKNNGRNNLLDTSWRPDADELTRRLSGWIAQRFPAGSRLTQAAFPEEGGSSLNLMFSVEDREQRTGRYVARMSSPDPQHQTFPDESLEREARIMRVVRRHTGLPVPEILHYEDDRSWLGTPFLVMPRIDGRPWPSDPPYNFSGWVLDSSPEDRSAMQRQLVAVLAELHQITADKFDLREFERPHLGRDPLECQVNYVRQLYEWGRAGVRYPLLETALELLSSNLPRRSEPACVNWGDSRAGNLLFHNGRVTAVLDWEGAALGHPEADVAFVCLMHRYYQQRAEALGIRGIPDAFRPADLAAEYASLTGRQLDDLSWYETLGAARAAAIQVRVVTRSGARGAAHSSDPDKVLSIAPVLRDLTAHMAR